MPVLSEDIKFYIVRSLACFNTPQEVAVLVKEEFGVEVNRAQIAGYDPTKPSSAKLGAKYRVIFEASRERYFTDIYSIPMANSAVRVSKLEKMFYEARKRNNNVLAAKHLEQIAKEVGHLYANKF